MSGIYLSSNPEYALRYAKGKTNPCLIFCYVIIANPYPIVHDDAPSQKDLRFYSMGNYKNYLSHYAPVIPYGDPSLTMDFRPPPIGRIRYSVNF